MSNMIHGWWLDRTWIENEASFIPLKDAAGRQVYQSTLNSGATYKSEFGEITRKKIKYAELSAVTVGPNAPATGGLIETDPNSPLYGQLTVSGPSGLIPLSPLDLQWHQFTEVETVAGDRILDLWIHRVSFRSIKVEYEYGTYSELDPPDIDPLAESE